VRIWDPLMRFSHWLLAAEFAIAYVTEGEPEWLRTYAGHAVSGVVALRIVWGFVGPRRARFADFVTGPRAALAYLKKLIAGTPPRYLGHSPAGGVMTVALLAALAAATFTGMANFAAKDGEGPLAGIIEMTPRPVEGAGQATAEQRGGENGGEHDGGEGGESLWQEAHGIFTNLALLPVGLRLRGVAPASWKHRENLPRAMVTGDKHA
jgi:cytochrome b